MITREKIANVIDAFADYLEETEGKQLAAERAERAGRIDKLASFFERKTGQSLPAEKREALSQLDHDTLDHLMKIAAVPEEGPDVLGQPSDYGSPRPATTVKEAAKQAEDNFVNWVLS